jgi:hypothetical protein
VPSRWISRSFAVIALVGLSDTACADEVVGKRRFANTLVISEPFVEDEVTLPSVLRLRRAEGRALATEFGVEVKKRLTSKLEFSVEGALTRLDDRQGGAITGLENLEVGLKYELFRDPSREAVGSLALTWEIGGTGRSAVGATPFHAVTPAVFVGKGLGDLPALPSILKPFALTGALGLRIPAGGDDPNTLEWGLVVQYSLPYLESHVRRLGLPVPLDRLIPLIELSGATALDGAGGRTTGTANAGVVWAGDQMQLGVEAVIPLNPRSGPDVGVRAFMRFSLDEIFGGRLGRPLFGRDD